MKNHEKKQEMQYSTNSNILNENNYLNMGLLNRIVSTETKIFLMLSNYALKC